MPENSLVTLPSPRVAVSSSVPPPVSMAVIEESSTATDVHPHLVSMDERLRAKAAVRDKDSTRDSTKDSTRHSLNTQLFEQQHQGQCGQKISLYHASGADI